jgi:hypothetical protein
MRVLRATSAAVWKSPRTVKETMPEKSRIWRAATS